MLATGKETFAFLFFWLFLVINGTEDLCHTDLQTGWDPLGTSGHVFNDQLMSGWWRPLPGEISHDQGALPMTSLRLLWFLADCL